MEIARLAGRLRGKGLGRLPGAQLVYKLLLPRRATLRKVKVLNFEMWIDLKDIGDLTPALLARGVYSPTMTQVVKDIIKPRMTCIDVGANIGYFTILMSKLAGTVYAYEPELTNYNLLMKNLALNEVANVYPTFGAISNEWGVGTLKVSSKFYGNHCLSKSTLGQSTDLDTLDATFSSKKVDFVKVAVQGAEMQVLEGMNETLKYNPNIVMAWLYLPGGLRRFDCEPVKFLKKFEERGLSLWDMDEKRKQVIPMNVTQILAKYRDTQATHILVRREEG